VSAMCQPPPPVSKLGAPHETTRANIGTLLANAKPMPTQGRHKVSQVRVCVPKLYPLAYHQSWHDVCLRKLGMVLAWA